MVHMPVLVIGRDAAWRSRMQRLLALRVDLDWLGAFAPAEPRRAYGGRPDVLLLDGDDPDTDRAPRRTLQRVPRRIYFFRNPGRESLARCGRVLAHGCLDKLASANTVLMAVRAVEAGLCVLEPSLLHMAATATEGKGATDSTVDTVRAGIASPPGLTARQAEILRWASVGLSNKQIARRLGISPETVKSHLHAAFLREGVHGRVELVARALAAGTVRKVPPAD